MNIAVCGFTPFAWFILVYSHNGKKKKEMKIKMKQMLIGANWSLHLFSERESIEVWFYCVDLKHEASSRKQLAASVLLTARQLH